MLRTNLSTRPFYNERAVHLLLALAGLVVAVVSAFNAIRIVSLSRQNTELSSLIDRDHDEAARLTLDAQRTRATIIDFKSDRVADASSIARATNAHRPQLHLYARAADGACTAGRVSRQVVPSPSSLSTSSSPPSRRARRCTSASPIPAST